MTDSRPRRPVRRIAVAALAAAILSACAGSGSAPQAGPAARGGRSTQDARVRSFAGRTPPDVFTNGTWVGRAGPTSLAALRGRVVYVQFAFPT